MFLNIGVYTRAVVAAPWNANASARPVVFVGGRVCTSGGPHGGCLEWVEGAAAVLAPARDVQKGYDLAN